MTQISVLIPVYNVQAYLSECLDSLLAQDFQDWEAICVNDGSTDNSLQILNEYVSKDPRFKIISQTNQGLSAARNAALEVATGNWIIFLDSDDMLVRNALSTLYRVAQESDQPVIVPTSFGSIGQDNTAPTTDYKICQPALETLLKNPRGYSSACGKLYRADILKGRRFIPGIYFEDWPFIVTLFAYIPSFASITNKLYLYRQADGSIVRSAFSAHKIDSYIIGMQFVKEQLGNTPFATLAKKRCSVAMRMCINKTWRDKEHRKILAPHLVKQIQAAHQKGYFSWKYISLKTIARYLVMKYLYNQSKESL